MVPERKKKDSPNLKLDTHDGKSRYFSVSSSLVSLELTLVCSSGKLLREIDVLYKRIVQLPKCCLRDF